VNVWRAGRKTVAIVGGLLVVFAVATASYKLLKTVSRKHNLGVWSQQPSLESLDPTERIEAARAAARKYGGKT
jgi:hypothetical protein